MRFTTKILSGFLALTLTASLGATAFAQNDPISTRRAIMKNVGGATKTASGLAKGDMPYDGLKAQDALRVYIDAAKRMPALYPKGTETGGDTTASPKIWSDEAGFKAAFMKFEKDSEAALGKTKDLESFKTAFAELSKNCQSCHENYRIKKN
jgi:cytochrome c556